MNPEDSVAYWLEHLKKGDDRAAQEIFDRFSKQLCRVARGKLGSSSRRAEDEEDVVQSAFLSFVCGVQQGRYPGLFDRQGVWRLLAVITERKAINQRKRQMAKKRGGGDVRGDSVCITPVKDGGQVGGGGSEPTTPDMNAEFNDLLARLLGKLDDDLLRTVAVLRLQSYTNAEIAQQLNVVERTVERKLKTIRSQWCLEFDESPQ